jgi:hypothetical protein
MGSVVMYSTVSVDGFVADSDDQPGPLFDWLTNGDVPLDESGEVKVSQASYDYTRPNWDQIGVTIVGRHVFDLTDGWGGNPPGGIPHVVVVTHRPAPDLWNREAFHFVDGIEAARGPRVRQALLRVGRCPTPAGERPRRHPRRPGASPALPGAPVGSGNAAARATSGAGAGSPWL